MLDTRLIYLWPVFRTGLHVNRMISNGCQATSMAKQSTLLYTAYAVAHGCPLSVHPHNGLQVYNVRVTGSHWGQPTIQNVRVSQYHETMRRCATSS